jgi:uncharacterized membrane protein (DUF485 family)
MTEKTNKVPGIAIINIAGGLLLMAFFTIIWSIIAENEMNGNDNGVVLIAFGLFSLTFIIYALYLFSISKRFPTLSNDAQKLEGKKFAK